MLIRKLDLSTFTGDTWATPAAQAVPPPEAVVLVATGGPVRWLIAPMDGADDDAEAVADAVTRADARAVKIVACPREQRIPAFVASIVEAQTIAHRIGFEITEDDMSRGQHFALGVPSLTAAEGSAPWAWILLLEGAVLA